MTFDQELRSYLLQSMRSALIISPRFTDYKISQVEFPSDFGAILEEEIKRIVKEEGQAKGASAGGLKPGLYIDEPDKTQLEKMLEKSLGGPSKARDAMQFLVNPTGAVKALLTKAGGPGAIAAVLSAIVLGILIKELVRKGSVYDRTFKNVVDNRTEVLRTRQQQQQILVGFDEHSALGSQLITTTIAGTTEPRDAFNTYEVLNRDSATIEDMFSIRSNDGI